MPIMYSDQGITPLRPQNGPCLNARNFVIANTSAYLFYIIMYGVPFYFLKC